MQQILDDFIKVYFTASSLLLHGMQFRHLEIAICIEIAPMKGHGIAVPSKKCFPAQELGYMVYPITFTPALMFFVSL